MDNKPQAPLGGNDTIDQTKPSAPPVISAPLANYDFDRELDEKPVTPGPLLQQQSAKSAVNNSQKKSKKNVWIALIGSLILILMAAAGIFYWQSMEYRKQTEAAYTQLLAKTVENKKLKQAANSTAPSAPKEPTAAEKLIADKAAITDVITAKLHAPTQSKDEKLSINIMKQDSSFAYVNAGPASGSAAAYILKKVDKQWVIIYSGQENISAEVVKTYGIPIEFQSGQ